MMKVSAVGGHGFVVYLRNAGLVVVLALLAPTVEAGTAANPELQDPRGDEQASPLPALPPNDVSGTADLLGIYFEEVNRTVVEVTMVLARVDRTWEGTTQTYTGRGFDFSSNRSDLRGYVFNVGESHGLTGLSTPASGLSVYRDSDLVDGYAVPAIFNNQDSEVSWILKREWLLNPIANESYTITMASARSDFSPAVQISDDEVGATIRPFTFTMDTFTNDTIDNPKEPPGDPDGSRDAPALGMTLLAVIATLVVWRRR